MSAPQQSQYAHTEEAKYIISLNEKLLTENNEQRATISEKDAEITTLEGDLGQRETQVTYMRGLLKNFVAIDELRKDIKKSTDGVIHEQMNIMVRMETQNKKFNNISWYYSIVTCTLFALCLFGVSPVYILPLVSASDYIIQTWRVNSLDNLTKVMERINTRKSAKMNEIKAKKDELESIIKGCDFLNEYIDSI